MRRYLLIALLAVPAAALAAPPGGYTPDLPAGAVRYESEKYTQAISKLYDTPRVRKVPVRELEARWHQSGGMHRVSGARSEKFRTLPPGKRVDYRLALLEIENGIPKPGGGNYRQKEYAVQRSYPVGTRFDDVLYNRHGQVFEHRVREKTWKGWKSRVAFSDQLRRPPGYAGLKQSCASCHDEAGSGGYAKGLVPGGDTVLSDPMDWSVARRPGHILD